MKNEPKEWISHKTGERVESTHERKREGAERERKENEWRRKKEGVGEGVGGRKRERGERERQTMITFAVAIFQVDERGDQKGLSST